MVFVAGWFDYLDVIAGDNNTMFKRKRVDEGRRGTNSSLSPAIDQNPNGMCEPYLSFHLDLRSLINVLPVVIFLSWRFQNRNGEAFANSYHEECQIEKRG